MNLTREELIDWLRYRAIEFGAPPQFVDAIDDLGTIINQEDEIAELTEERDDVLTMLRMAKRRRKQ